jgi:hypothetical protein
VGANGSIAAGQADQPSPYTGDGAAIYIRDGATNTVTNNGSM